MKLLMLRYYQNISEVQFILVRILRLIITHVIVRLDQGNVLSYVICIRPKIIWSCLNCFGLDQTSLFLSIIQKSKGPDHLAPSLGPLGRYVCSLLATQKSAKMPQTGGKMIWSFNDQNHFGHP